jgi:hypothetical protein
MRQAVRAMTATYAPLPFEYETSDFDRSLQWRNFAKRRNTRPALSRSLPLLFVLRPAVALAAFLSLTLSAAADCAFRVGPAATPASVSKYLPVLQSCEAADGRRAMSIREMTIGGESVALLADPEALTTRLERLACWTCRDASEDELASTRMGRAIAASAEAPGIAHRGFLQNAGLTRGAKPGAFVTGDLCPSPKPLDRAFFTRLAATGPHTPVALAVSGLWLTYHPKDFRWLAGQRDAGALDIVWVDHTYTHPYRRKLPNASNYLLTRGVNPEDEILRTEKLIIASGETPSLFFRFPGLVSSDPLMEAVRRFHLVTLGADAWRAIGQKPGPGSIVLVHPNGNEPFGLKVFSADVARGAIPKPLEPLTAAPE